MGQKTNPVGFRLGIIRGWDSNWYAEKDFSEKLVEDEDQDPCQQDEELHGHLKNGVEY